MLIIQKINNLSRSTNNKNYKIKDRFNLLTQPLAFTGIFRLKNKVDSHSIQTGVNNRR